LYLRTFFYFYQRGSKRNFFPKQTVDLKLDSAYSRRTRPEFQSAKVVPITYFPYNKTGFGGDLGRMKFRPSRDRPPHRYSIVQNRSMACDSMVGEFCIAQQRHYLIYKNAVGKIETTFVPSRHPFSLNKMVASPTFHGGKRSIQ
jgi:hypothetical protein